MTRGRVPLAVVLCAEERVELERWSRWPTAPHSIAQRARIVLLTADGLSNVVICERVGVNHTTVTKWRKRFVAGGLDALVDEPRPGVPSKFGDAAIEAIVVKTLTEKPKGSTDWSTREMAKATGMSQPTVAKDLEGVRVETVGGGHVQTVRGSVVHRQGS